MSQSLQNALIDPDDNAACRSLHELLTKEAVPASPARLATAKAYLEAFCDQSRPLIRRRWTGLVLARLLESCPEVAVHLSRDPDDLVRVGAVIMGLNEAEETKIVAGLIIRAGLSHGIKFSDFWSERKIQATATFFPNVADAAWMKAFQDYMDMLSGLSPESSPSKLVLLYPVALYAADGYGWSPRDENLPILLIESQTLTIITPAPALQDVEFVYIPFKSIKNVRCKPSNLYDSQGGVVPAAPWAVVLEFMSSSTPYQVNCSDRSGSDFTIILECSADAKDCMRCLSDVLHPQGGSNNTTKTSSPALYGDLSEEKVIRSDAQAISRGGIIKFDRSQRERSIIQDSQQAEQTAAEAVHGTGSESIRARRGALPEVKKTLRLSGTKSTLDTTQTDFEFPDHSPSIKRPAKTKTQKLTAIRTSYGTSQMSAPKSNSRKPTASKTKPRSSEEIRSHDHVNDEKDCSNSNIKIEAPTSKESRAGNERAGTPRRPKSDVFSLTQESRDKKDARRGTRRTRATAMIYKEDSSSEESSSGCEFAESERTKKARTRPSKLTLKKEPFASSPTKSGTSSRRTRQAKASTRLQQPLKGSLLSNLQPTLVAKGQKANGSKTGDEVPDLQEPTVAARTKHKAKSRSGPGQENSSSGAHILKRLNDPENDNEHGEIYASKTKNSVASRKRTAASITPSTPCSKRVKSHHDEMEANAVVAESTSMKPPPTVAPVRVLEDPSSPCGSRADKTMQAPPKPAAEEFVRVTSPRTSQSSLRGRKQIDERQTPVHQLGRRSHSRMSSNLEILSSNSKPTPASPRAASTAISGHADRHEVVMEQAQGDYKIEKSNPFRVNHRNINKFTRRLTGSRGVPQRTESKDGNSLDHPIELGDSPSSSSSEALPPMKTSSVPKYSYTGISQPIELLQIRTPERARSSRCRTEEPPVSKVLPAEASLHYGGHQQEAEARLADDAEVAGDTLVGFEEPPQAQDEVSLTHLRSSPPPMDHSPSSHSSTSAEPEPKTDPLVPTSQAEKEEWEASLQPYQRDLKDELLRVSSRVLQHIVDNESAVNDIADTYTKDGQHSLQLLFEKHEQEFNTMHKDIKQKKAKMNKATEKALLKLRKERQNIEDENE